MKQKVTSEKLAWNKAQVKLMWDTEVKPYPTAIRMVDNYYLRCPLGHRTEGLYSQIVRMNSDTLCKVCSNRELLTGYNDLATKHPELLKFWSPENPPANKVRFNGVSKYQWVCDKGHKWLFQISYQLKKNDCRFCEGRTLVKGQNDLATVNPELLKEWDYSKNSLLPSELHFGSTQKVHWVCSKGHSWDMSLSSRTQKKAQNCPYCSNKRVMSGYNDLATTHPELLAQWDFEENKIKPTEITAGSGKNIHWVDKKCGHKWVAKPNSRSSSNTTCPYCSNRKVLVGFNDLETTRPELVEEWHPTKNAGLSPSEVTYGSTQRVWWQCSKDHVWNTPVYSRGTVGSTIGCPSCAYNEGASKAELEIREWLTANNVTFTTSTRDIIPPLELDIYIPEKKIAIEYNGLYWHSEATGKTETYHYDKWKACKDKGVHLIQIWEDDWLTKPDLLKRMVAHKLGIKNPVTVYARKTKIVRPTKEEMIKFYEANHLQGYRFGATYYALEHEGIIVAALGIQKTGSKLEISRYATACSVPGGFSKLLNNILLMNKGVSEIFSYSHNDHSDGNMYETNGFALVHEGKAGYFYLSKNRRTRQDRSQYQKRTFRENPNLKYREGLTERELADLNGLTRIWDAGSSLWVKNITFAQRNP